MLQNKDSLISRGDVVNAEIQRMERIIPPRAVAPGGEAHSGEQRRLSRYRMVVDKRGHECGAVTRHYRLITNGDLIAAVDLASDELGVDIEVGKSRYYNGRSQYDFYMPDEFRVPGDPSGVRPQITLGNSYGGKAALTGMAGVFRLVCTNGMIIGQTLRRDYQRHIGEFDTFKFVKDLMEVVIARAQEYQATALIAAETEFSVRIEGVLDEAVRAQRERNMEYITQLQDDTPKKYHKRMRESLRTNRNELGHNVWAIMQAISEVSTHDMEGWAAGNWQRRQTERLLETVGIEA